MIDHEWLFGYFDILTYEVVYATCDAPDKNMSVVELRQPRARSHLRLSCDAAERCSSRIVLLRVNGPQMNGT